MGLTDYLPWIGTQTTAEDDPVSPTDQTDNETESLTPTYCDTSLTERTYEVVTDDKRFTVSAKQMRIVDGSTYQFYNYGPDDVLCKLHISAYSQHTYRADTPLCDGPSRDTFHIAVRNPQTVEAIDTRHVHFIGWTNDGSEFDEATIVPEYEYQEYGTDLLDVPDDE